MHAGNENVNVRASMATGWHLDADRLYTVVLYVGAISILLGHPERRNLPRIRPEWYINCGCFDGTADLRQEIDRTPGGMRFVHTYVITTHGIVYFVFSAYYVPGDR